MAYENLIVIDRGPVRIIEINRPKALNALNRAVLRELDRALNDVEDKLDVRACILTGMGEKAFVAGADLAEMKSLTPYEAERFSDLGHSVMDKIEASRVPMIAAVNGFALGGGLELALACDFIYASDNALLGLVEVDLALIPGFGGTTRLLRRVGIGMAREMIYTGKKLKAEEAKRIGLVNKITALDELVDSAVRTGEKIAEKGPLAVEMVKRVLLHTQDSDTRIANAMERQSFGLVFGTSDHTEGINAFLEKRKPSYEGK
jgi:enoyl-CoA hydratase